jgi:hypothetical protein
MMTHTASRAGQESGSRIIGRGNPTIPACQTQDDRRPIIGEIRLWACGWVSFDFLLKVHPTPCRWHFLVAFWDLTASSRG